MNKGGFSWRRLTGVTAAKNRVSRATGIPWTKGGRQRKIGKAVTGGGCALPAAAVLAVVAVLVAWVTPARAAVPEIVGADPPGRFDLIGHDPLYGRGMNAAPAYYNGFLYVGSRTDGTPQHPHPGVLVVDVRTPSAPKVAGEIGAPNEGNVGETSRELRVWPRQKLLLVLNFGCSAILHACTSPAETGATLAPPSIKFYDLTVPASPVLIATYLPSRTPHEIFLWQDPADAGRALLFMSTPTSSADPARPNLIVTDISRARNNTFTEIATWNGNPAFTAAERDGADVRLHSIGVSVSGTRTYLAYLGGGFFVLDSSAVASGAKNPALRLVTPVAKRVHWGNPGAHTAAKVPGQDVVLMTDEVYGDSLDPITGDNHGCPWGWVRMIGVGNETAPALRSEFKMPQNVAAQCEGTDGVDPADTLATSYSSHNPTLLRSLALITWHSAGLVAMGYTNPAKPALLANFLPEPLASVSTEDPALSAGRSKVVMWSYPIIADGLIYVIDIRNGLFILRYRGPHQGEIASVRFLEGNSNLGDAAGLESAVQGTRQVAKPAPAAVKRGPLPATGIDGHALPFAGLALAAVALAAGTAARARRRS